MMNHVEIAETRIELDRLRRDMTKIGLAADECARDLAELEANLTTRRQLSLFHRLVNQLVIIRQTALLARERQTPREVEVKP